MFVDDATYDKTEEGFEIPDILEYMPHEGWETVEESC